MFKMTAVGVVAALLCLGTALAGGDKPTWVKWDDAKPTSTATGKPIFVYSTVDEKGGSCWGGTTATDRALGQDDVAKHAQEFIFVRCSDKATSSKVGSKTPPEGIFFDPDGEEIYRTRLSDAASVDAAMNEANRRYANKEVSWNVYDDKALAAAKDAKKLAVMVFENNSKDSEATLKAFEDRLLVKLHDKCTFIRLQWNKDSEESKTWGVMTAPMVLIVDPNKDAGAKAVIDRASGRKSPAGLKAMILKGLKALEKSSR